jgi:hypothetical protein
MLRDVCEDMYGLLSGLFGRLTFAISYLVVMSFELGLYVFRTHIESRFNNPLPCCNSI